MKDLLLKSNVIIHPGLGNSGEDHWQTRWEKRFHFNRVHQRDWDSPICSEWIEVLDKKLTSFDPSTIIYVGHSLACVTLAYWAKKYKRALKGALLVAPSDTEAPSYPVGTIGFSPMLLEPLPFPSIVVTTTDDFYVNLDRATQFAAAWGSELVNIGKGGHINVASGHGEWSDGLQYLKRLDR